MKKISRKYRHFIALFLTMSMAGCYSELQDLELGEGFQWSPELGVPLVDSEFTLKDILETEAAGINFNTDERNTIVINITEDSLFSQSASDYFSLNDETIVVPPLILTQEQIDLFNANGSVIVIQEVFVDYPQPSGLSEIVIDRGNLVSQVEENFPADIDLSYSLEDPFNNPIPGYSNFFNYNVGEDPISTAQSASEFRNINFQFGEDSTLSKVKVSFEIEITRVDQDLVFGENSIDLTISFRDMDYGALYGDLPSQDISTEENTINTDFFNQDELLGDIEYYLNNPQFKLTLKNSMGLPVRFDVNNFTTYNDGRPSPEPINSAILLPQAEEGSVAESETDFDSQFKEIVNSLPDSVSLQIDGLIDPNNSPRNYVTRDSYIQVGYEVNIPLELRLSGLEINESFSIDGIDAQDTEYAYFKFTSTNSLPLDLVLTADLLDEDSMVVRNLFDGVELLKGGSTTSPEAISNIIKLEGNLEDLQRVRRVGIRATLATSTPTPPDDFVRISADAAVKFNLAVQAQYTVEF
ncbi:hypothetical protein [Marivirga sp.]|uniref:hypothetical protein n=1 Tax=Marivirga sp. TaxID=2018662 RepID=UPI002D7E6FC4|nr:hypothetical protein [Marivirga sp.]HET8859777.1 hypothetical protein [Marivirga sp.]